MTLKNYLLCTKCVRVRHPNFKRSVATNMFLHTLAFGCLCLRDLLLM